MKSCVLFVSSLAVASAFAPLHAGRPATHLQESLADKIFGMDLFAPNPEVNDYGSRGKKNLKQGTITGNSYVPSGLSAAQYQKIRASDQSKKDSNYKRNVSKAGVFQDFDKFYIQRGTSEGGNWLKAPGRGHTFAKTKFDFSGEGSPSMQDMKVPEAFTLPSIFGGKKK